MKKTRSIFVLLALALMAALLISGCALFSNLGGGDGGSKAKAEPVDESFDISWYDAKSTTFTLSNEKQLAGLARITSRARNDDDFAGKTINLGGNIDLAGIDWKPISPFRGTFDGKGFTISNLSSTGADIAGLFGAVEMGTIKNLVVRVKKVETKKGTATVAGGLAGFGLNITIENCGVIIEDSITAYSERSGSSGTHTAFAGGLVGSIDGPMTTSTINNSYVTGNVSAVSGVGGGSVAGGLVGNVGLAMFRVSIIINNCYAVGSVTSTSADSNPFAGGFIGSGGIFQADVKTSFSSTTLNSTVENTRGGRNEPFSGGIFGRWTSGTNTSVYYNSTKVTSEKISGGGAKGDQLPTGITGVTDANMKRQASFAGFDFGTVWAIDASTNSGYPYLRWQRR